MTFSFPQIRLKFDDLALDFIRMAPKGSRFIVVCACCIFIIAVWTILLPLLIEPSIGFDPSVRLSMDPKKVPDLVDKAKHAFQLYTEYAKNNLRSAAAVNHNNHARTSSSKKGLLCSVFLDCSESGLKQFISNFKEMFHNCDWALVCYADSLNGSYASIIQNTLTKLGLTVVHCKYISNRQELITNYTQYPYHTTKEYKVDPYYNDMIYPKPVLFIQLYTLLPYYTYIWLLDSDISFKNFDYNTFYNLLYCTLSPPPLISQPLIYENTQTYKYLNRNTWDKYQNKNKVKYALVESGFIEIQAPVIDTQYFIWYLDTIIKPILWSSHLLGKPQVTVCMYTLCVYTICVCVMYTVYALCI